ncbi:hypothetical protein ABH973_000067 [Bradyrhizobium ottawaense]
MCFSRSRHGRDLRGGDRPFHLDWNVLNGCSGRRPNRPGRPIGSGQLGSTAMQELFGPEVRDGLHKAPNVVGAIDLSLGLIRRPGISSLRAAHGIQHPRDRRMRSVLHLDPVLRSTGSITPVASFRDQALKAHATGSTKQIRAYLSGLERGDENPVGRPRSRRARLVLRTDSGSGRRSSPPSASTSKA